uniref:Glutathione S-transferase n=1 Tax=Ostrinia furnacalis TaxID=93504 RepID=V9I161_OSTFU|nr:glutathione S-transferase [Ostrinia furnacalis]
MSIDLYYTAGSAPCRLVLLVAAALNLELNLKPLDLRAGEQLTPEFLQLNPQHTVPTIIDDGFSLNPPHTVPTIVDDGFSLWESRAISRYLVNKYGGAALYPEDPKARALVDQRLDFDLGTLYPRFATYFYPQVLAGAPADEALLKMLEEALKFLDTFLEGQKYAAGSELTLADLSLVATVSTIDAAGISIESYQSVNKWFTLVKSTAPKYDEANGQGVEMFRAFVAQLKAKTEL